MYKTPLLFDSSNILIDTCRPTMVSTGNGELGFVYSLCSLHRDHIADTVPGSIPEREPEKRRPHPRKTAGAQYMVPYASFGSISAPLPSQCLSNTHPPPPPPRLYNHTDHLLPRTLFHTATRDSLIPSTLPIPPSSPPPQNTQFPCSHASHPSISQA